MGKQGSLTPPQQQTTNVPVDHNTDLKELVITASNTCGTTVSVPDGELFYRLRGEGEPVVFIHGFSLDSRMWQPQFEFLATTHQAIAYDVRGFGRSSEPRQPFTHHDDLKTLLDALQLDSAHLVGFSMGGRIALNFAVNYPQRVRSLALFGSNLDGAVFDLGWKPQPDDMQASKQEWLKHALFTSISHHPTVEQLVADMVSDYSGWHWKNASLEIGSAVKTIDRLSEIPARTLVVVGEHDLPPVHTIADTLIVKVPLATKFIVPECGHMVTLEAPESCNQLLQGHLISESLGQAYVNG